MAATTATARRTASLVSTWRGLTWWTRARAKFWLRRCNLGGVATLRFASADEFRLLYGITSRRSTFNRWFSPYRTGGGTYSVALPEGADDFYKRLPAAISPRGVVYGSMRVLRVFDVTHGPRVIPKEVSFDKMFKEKYADDAFPAPPSSTSWEHTDAKSGIVTRVIKI